MGQKRLKGQEVFITLLGDGKELKATWKAIVNFDFTDDIEILDEGYIGETSQRYDSVYNGTSFSAEGHMHSKNEDDLRIAIKDKAQRRDGSIGRFDIGMTIPYPSGATRTITLLDVEFGSVKISVGGRAEYVSISFEGNCSETSVSDA
jgi:hypothetical protein